MKNGRAKFAFGTWKPAAIIGGTGISKIGRPWRQPLRTGGMNRRPPVRLPAGHQRVRYSPKWFFVRRLCKTFCGSSRRRSLDGLGIGGGADGNVGRREMRRTRV